MDLDLEKVRGAYQSYVNDNCVCQYCGFDGKRSAEDWAQLQIDHLIPRGISREHKDDPLNLVVACYYCNTQKKDFDPSDGKLERVPDKKIRMELIQVAIEHLAQKKEKMWGYGGGFKGSFSHMMETIKKNGGTSA